MKVKKRSGEIVSFDPNKIRKWILWSIQGLKDQAKYEYEILSGTLDRLPDLVTTEDIHQAMIGVCLDKEEIGYSRIAAKLEMASIYKAQENLLGLLHPQTLDFEDYLNVMVEEGLWAGKWIDDLINFDRLNDWYIELEARSLEYWTVKQWSDKYSQKIEKQAIETPALGCLAIALAIHGDTPLAFKTAKALIKYKLNLPTPVLNGMRNGNMNSISCCVIEGGDSIDSIDVAEHIASSMTARKAGIGITLDTRAKGDRVKKGAVEHLGKRPLYKAIESAVKKYTQETRGGSATVTFKCIDPEINSMLLWKTQRIDVSQRIDKLDYSFAYNDAFVEAVINNDDWHLFSLADAPEVHANIHKDDYMNYVRKALRVGTPHTKVKAIDVLLNFLYSRGETGRVYCINLSTANKHTPFMDTITQSNLCMEIQLPTKAYTNMYDLYAKDNSVGETAFCALAALNVANIAPEEYEEIAEIALRTVDKMIELSNLPTEAMQNDLLRRRSIGIGITGLASAIYQEGLDYDGSPESIDLVETIAETHYYYLLKASQKLSKESGVEVEGIDTNWLPIDTMPIDTAYMLDWEALRGKPRKHSVLVAHMPTESSAVFSSATNGLYPSRERVIYKKARKGKIQFISEHFTKDKLRAWDVDMIPYYAAVQSFSDQAISADYYIDFTKYEGRKVPAEELITWFVRQAKAGIKTAYYLNFKDGGAENSQTADDCDGCKL